MIEELRALLAEGGDAVAWPVAATGAVLLTLALLWLRGATVRRLRAHAERTEALLDDYAAEVIEGTRFMFLLALSAYLALQTIELAPRFVRLADEAIIVVLLLQAALWGNRGITLWLQHHIAKQFAADAGTATTMSVLGFIARVVLWATVTLMVLDNLGVNITALVASLGIGGIAVALAAQNVLGDVFASIAIALDKPFAIGDFIVVGDSMGTIEHIGLKTTRMRSLSGEQIVFSNSDLLASRMRNYKRMQERRVLFGFGVLYDTPVELLERIPQMVREIVEAQPKLRFDRAHFKAFGDSSLDFEVVYYVLDPDYNVYMDHQQAINLALFARLQREGIGFAFPTRTLHIASGTPPSAAS